MSTTTLPARVGNLSFLIERVASDTSPQREIRELTQNAIETIMRLPERSFWTQQATYPSHFV